MLSIYINLTFFLIITTLLILFLFIKKNIFLDIKDTEHKKFTTQTKNHSIGGLILLIFFLYFHFFIAQLQIFHILFFGLFFLTGLFSDFKILENPKQRFLIQTIILFIFIYLVDLKIPLTKIDIVDYCLKNIFFNKIFTVFCLMILINGSNFSDGINTLLIGYYVLVCSFLLLFFETKLPNILIIQCLLIALVILSIFNFFGKIILGDSGSYLLSFFIGIYLINFSNSTDSFSPFFVILLIWYPCFELLFSMIRRIISKNKMYEPDTRHFHQILYKFYNKNIKNEKINHLAVSASINGYNLLMLLTITNINTSMRVSHILFVILINLFIYILSYTFLKKALKRN